MQTSRTSSKMMRRCILWNYSNWNEAVKSGHLQTFRYTYDLTKMDYLKKIALMLLCCGYIFLTKGNIVIFFFFFTCIFKLENQICVRSLRKVTPSHISTLTAYMCQTELLTANWFILQVYWNHSFNRKKAGTGLMLMACWEGEEGQGKRTGTNIYHTCK